MSDKKAARIAKAQEGIITRAQALDAGMTLSALRHALRANGPWQRVLPGVYATFSGALTDTNRLRAASLYTGEDALITGPWACTMSGLKYGPEPSKRIDVLVKHGARRRARGFVRVIQTTRPARRVIWQVNETPDYSQYVGVDDDLREFGVVPGGIPMVPASRAVIDTATNLKSVGWQPTCMEAEGCPQCLEHESHHTLALRNVRALMCEAVQTRKASIADLHKEVIAASRRGSRLAQTALDDILAGCRSAPECELRDLVRSSKVLPEPRWNQLLPDSNLRIYPDACWAVARLVVEVDSRSFHGFGDAPAQTEERRARYAQLGWRVLPVSPSRLRAHPAAVLTEIESAYRAGLS